MRSLVLFFLIFCCIHAHGAEVVPATDADFDDVIKKGQIALVKFYAPWCGHCKKLAPEWEKAAKDIPGEALMIDVDCTKEKELAKKYEIKGYPTIILFRNGEKVELYEGGRQSDEIVSYIKSNVGPAVIYPESAEELAKLKEEHDTVCVVLTSDVNSDLSTATAAIAEGMRGRMKFAVVYDPKFVPDQKPETLVVYRKSDEESEEYSGDMGWVNLEQFLRTALVPYAGEISPSTYKLYAATKLPTLWVFLKPSEELSTEIKPQLKELGKKVRSHLALIWVNIEVYTGVTKHLGIPGDAKFPAFMIANGEKQFVPSTVEAATVESMELYVKDFAEGKLTSIIKSQPVPEVETTDGLTTVVGKTLSNHLSSGKDMLIEFYAPWCGHCKQLAPIYAKVAKEFEPYDVVIAALDATENDFDRSMFEVSGFPTVYFVPHGQKAILFQGDRTFYDLYKFVREHASPSQDKPIPPEPTKENTEEEKTASSVNEKEDL